VLDIDSLYELSSPNLFIFEGSLFFVSTGYEDVPSQNEVVPQHYVEKIQ
jgi:hypothetical protein